MSTSSVDGTVAWRGIREWHIVAALTVVGGVLRLWNLKHLGLVHFDEGIYASSGLWSLSREGLAGVGPRLIPYAPPGYVVLVGLAYLVLGASDIAAILVSILAGTLTIPAAAWLAHRSIKSLSKRMLGTDEETVVALFGPGAGAAAAATVALSGSQIAFSRMALVDASFLLVFTLGLIAAQTFLEKPALRTAITLGIAVGVAQLFKYNGWVLGAIVLVGALIDPLINAAGREKPRVFHVWGYGLLAALIAAIVYSPWFWYVETHGGYTALLRHQQSYAGGLGSWTPHWVQQVNQAKVLNGGMAWNGITAIVILTVLCLLNPPRWDRRVLGSAMILALLSTTFASIGEYSLIGGINLILLIVMGRASGFVFLPVAWFLLFVLTSFYHPYARLWLPLDLLGRIGMNIVFFGLVWFQAGMLQPVAPPTNVEPVDSRTTIRLFGVLPIRADWLAVALFLVCFAVVFIWMPLLRYHSERTEQANRISFLAPSDSLRNATTRVIADLPKDVTQLAILARPPVAFYLAGEAPIAVKEGLKDLLEPLPGKAWALVDMAQLRQEGNLARSTEQLLERWEIVEKYPTELNLPTLLDVDPSAAKAGWSEAVDAPLWLLRPRTGA